MKTKLLLVVAIAGLVAMTQGLHAESAQRLGVGVNYWKMLDDIDVDNVDKDGFTWLVTYQYRPLALLKLEADIEVFPKRFQGIDSTAFAPEAYLILGSTIYGAVGIGILYANSEFAHDPFYALRAGLDLEVIPQLFLDLNVNYRASEIASMSDVVDDIHGDTLTLGAAVRYQF